MVSMRKALLMALPLSAGAGLLMGNTTVHAMQYRSQPVSLSMYPESLSERAYDRGARWAQDHGLPAADVCPAVDQDFLRGCISASSG